MKRSLFGLVFLAVFLVLFTFIGTTERQAVFAATEPSNPQLSPVKVMVIIYDPIMENLGGIRLHQWLWPTTGSVGYDPVVSTNQIVSDLNTKSHGNAKFEIVETQIRDEWPLHTNGQRYTDSTYVTDTQNKVWTLGNGDYVAIANDFSVVSKLTAGTIDEVWLWGGPGFGWFEGAMAGNDPFWVVGGPILGINSRNFIFMGFNYERSQSLAMHDFGHRMEGIMKKVYGSWNFGYGTQSPNILHSWDEFTAIDRVISGAGGLGNVHIPFNLLPGALDTYSDSTTSASTNASDWSNFPYLTGARSNGTCSLWGCTAAGYYLWWFDRIPYFSGFHDSVLADWWKYFTDVQQYSQTSRVIPHAAMTDFAEANASSWSCWADQSTCSLDNPDVYDYYKKAGVSSLRMTTSGALDTYVRYPSAQNANWDLTGYSAISFWALAYNSNSDGFQDPMVVYVKDSAGNGYKYESTGDVWDEAINHWQYYSIPLAGNSSWTRTTIGSPNFADMDYFEIYADTWGSGFTLYLDGLGFVADFTEDVQSDWSCTVTGGGSCTLSQPTSGILKDGVKKLQIDSTATGDVNLKYPSGGNANWDLYSQSFVTFWAYSTNPNAGKFENSSPTVILRTGTGNNYYTLYPTSSSLLNGSVGRWQRYEIPVKPNTSSVWSRTVTGAPTIDDIDSIEIHFDTSGTSAYTVVLDGIRFEDADYFEPTVTIDSPADGSNVSGMVNINVAAFDTMSLKRVDLLVDGVYVATDSLYPYTFSWDANSVSAGDHTITAKAYDLRGHVASDTEGVTTSAARTLHVFASDPIFSDDFESLGTSRWSGVTDSEGDLSVTMDSSLHGAAGVAVNIDNTTDMYLYDTTPNTETRYRSRFYLDPNSITMVSGDTFSVFAGRTSAGSAFHVQLNYSAVNGYRVRTQIYDDTGASINGDWISISDAPHSLEIDWKAATAVGANNGYVDFWVDGTASGSQTGIDNDTRRVDEVRLGAVANVDLTTLGTIFIDDFVSRKTTYIGTIGAPGDDIFLDGFESGGTSAWSGEVDAENDLTVTTGSALDGTYGLSALIDNTTDMYVKDASPLSVTRYRARFYLDPNTITMASADTFNIFAGRDSGGTAVNVQLNYSSGSGYRVRTAYYDDAANQQGGTYYNITDSSHYIEIDWKASSAPGANDGYVSLWVDGVLQGTQSGADNDTKRVDEARFGAVGNIDAGTSGTIFLDKFKSTKTQYIGL